MQPQWRWFESSLAKPVSLSAPDHLLHEETDCHIPQGELSRSFLWHARTQPQAQRVHVRMCECLDWDQPTQAQQPNKGITLLPCPEEPPFQFQWLQVRQWEGQGGNCASCYVPVV